MVRACQRASERANARAALDAALRGDWATLNEFLVSQRKATEAIAGASPKTLQRTAEQAKAHEAKRAHLKSQTKLQLDDKEIDPATALRLQREGAIEKFKLQRKRARLQRWMEGSKVLISAGLPQDDATTIEAGEVWLYVSSALQILPVVVLPFHSYKNGVRPWTLLHEKLKVKDVASLQLLVSRTPTSPRIHPHSLHKSCARCSLLLSCSADLSPSPRHCVGQQHLQSCGAKGRAQRAPSRRQADGGLI